VNRSGIQKIFCYAMIPLTSAYVMAADRNGALLYASGSTSVNGAAVQRSSAVFPGDIIRTGDSAQAYVSLSGASLTIARDSAVQIESTGFSVVDGTINVGTAKAGISAKAGGVTVTPASDLWTEFEISHRNGAIQIIARKGDLHVSDGTRTFTLLQGQSETGDDTSTRDSSDQGKHRGNKDNDPVPGARAPVIDSPIVIGIGSGVIIGGLVYVLTRSGAPVSPVTP